jgi:hypothetical protein
LEEFRQDIIHKDRYGDVRLMLIVLLAAVAFVLLIDEHCGLPVSAGAGEYVELNDCRGLTDEEMQPEFRRQLIIFVTLFA